LLRTWEQDPRQGKQPWHSCEPYFPCL
jgi:hypothetical protein